MKIPDSGNPVAPRIGVFELAMRAGILRMMVLMQAVIPTAVGDASQT